MRRLLLAVAAVFGCAVFMSCGPQVQCAAACALGVDITVKDTTGAPVQVDHGTLTLVENDPLTFTCGAANSAVTCDGGVVSGLTIGTSLTSVTLEVFDTQGRSFSGTVTTTTAPNGKEVCGQTCVQATGSVTVQ